MVLPAVEPVSLTIGVVALASLFTTCLDCFEMIELGRHFSRDVEILMTKLESQRLIFAIWGNAVGLDHDGMEFNDRLIGPEIQVGIYRLLNCIYTLFQDAENLQKMYGVKQSQFEKAKVKALESDPSSFTSHWDRFRSHLVFRLKKTMILAKTRWAIHDKNKFSALIADLKDLIDQLRDITASVADLERQRKAFAEEISSISDVASLELLEEALKEEEPELSEVASQRIVQLTNGSLCETTDLKALASESAYVTAPSTWSWEDAPKEEQILIAESTESSIAPLAPTEVSSEHTLLRAEDIIYGYQNNLKVIQQKDRDQVARAAYSARKKANGQRMHFSERAVLRQLRDVSKEQDSFISLAPFDDCLYELLGSMQGPMGTPYEGGVFFIRVDVPKDYPLHPPKCRFITPVYHPNIDREGKIIVNILEIGDDPAAVSEWSPIWTLSQVLIGICSLLDDPNWLQPLVPERARQYGEDPVAFEAQARIFTQRYAQRKVPSISEFAAASPENFHELSGSLQDVRKRPSRYLSYSLALILIFLIMLAYFWLRQSNII